MIVATFNIRHGRGTDGVVDLGRTSRAIAATRAELVALQELDRGLDRSGRVNQAAVLGELTGMSVRFFSTVRRGRGDYGIGIAARAEVDVEVRRLPRLGDEEPRAAIVGRWRDVSVIATHLSLRRGVREVQMSALAQLAARLTPPVLLLGDLNATRRRLSALRRAGLEGPACGTGAARLLGWRRVDHVLAGGGLEVVRCSAIASQASDHQPLAAQVRRRDAVTDVN